MMKASFQKNTEDDSKRIVYVPRAMTQATLPYTSVKGAEFIRQNGRKRLTVLTPSDLGVPFGVMPRILLIWLATEVVIKKSRHIYLGRSCRDFMIDLGFKHHSGGENGSYVRLRKQIRSLLGSTISFSEDAGCSHIEGGMRFSDFSNCWWEDDPDTSLDKGHVQLSEQFYFDISFSAMPIYLSAVKALKRSPMALDIYMWACSRVFNLPKSCLISWVELQKQFGANYQKVWHFELAFTKHLENVKAAYPNLKARAIKGRGLLLEPCLPHVPQQASALVDKPVSSKYIYA